VTARPVQAALVSALTFAAGAVLLLIVVSVAPPAQISVVVAGTTLLGLMALGGLELFPLIRFT